MENRTYRYFSGTPLYPFGHGLSYTRFSVSGASLEDSAVRTDVVNEGKMAGDALVQVYVRCDSLFAPRNPRLCGFGRISLMPGQRGTISVPLDPLTDTVVTDTGDEIKCSGYTLYIGLSQPDQFSAGLCGVQPLEIRKQTEV